jgi:hypothetical protein
MIKKEVLFKALLLFALLVIQSCKTSSVVRSLASLPSQLGYDCNGVQVASAEFCTLTSDLFSPNTLPLSYRGVIGKNLNTDTNSSQSYWGAYDTGLLHAIYDHNSYNTTNKNNRADIIMIGWGVAAKSSSGAFANLSTQTVANNDANLATSSGTSSWIDMSASYYPLIQGTNIIKYYTDNTTNVAYNSTPTASLITAITPTTDNNDNNKQYTSIGFSNEKIHNQVLGTSYTTEQIRDTFNSMSSYGNLFFYDFNTHFVNNAPNVRSAIFDDTNSFFKQNSTDKVMVIPLGEGVADATGTETSKNQKFLNNVFYTGSNYTSFAARVIPETYLIRNSTQISLMDPKKSVPVVAIPVMNYGEFDTDNKLKYYIPEDSYNAGALKNIALSVPVSYQSVVYYYDKSSNKMRTTMAGFNESYGTSGNATLGVARQASAILTAIIGNVQSGKSITTRDALRSIAFQSTPMYGEVVTDYSSGALPTEAIVNGTGTLKEYFRPKLISIPAANVAALLDQAAKPTNTPGVGTSYADQGNTNSVISDANLKTNGSYDNTKIGEAISKITSHDVVVKNGDNIIVMNDVWVGKNIITGYNTDGTAKTGNIDRIISLSSGETLHDRDKNATYTGYYFCLSGETDAQCKSPYRRIASNVYGFGMLNYRMLTGVYNLESVVRTTNSSSVASVSDTEMIVSPAFGDSLGSQTLAVQIQGANLAGETWSTVEDGRFRMSLTHSTSSFNSLFTSKAYQSANQVQSYNFATGLNSSFAFNLSSSNVFLLKDPNSPLSNSRFGDMVHNVSQFRNSFGVIASESGVKNNISNVAYSGGVAGLDFSLRSNFQPGLEINKVSNTNLNIMQKSSIYFNPFVALTSNQFNAHAFVVGKSFANGFGVNFSTTYGKANFTGQNLDLWNSVENSPNIAHAISIEHIKNNNKFNVDLGVLRESTTLLGAYSSGAFTLGRNNTTTFIKTKVEQNIFGSTSFIGAFALGKTNVGEQSSLSLFNNFSPIVSRSFVIGVKSRAFSGGNFELTYSQPLAIISGSLAFDSANGTQKISLIPTKQEQNYGISFTKETKKTRTSIQAAYILNQNNLNVKPTFGMFGTVSRAL